MYIPCTSDRFLYLVSSICFITPSASLATSPCVLVPSSVQTLYPLFFCLIDPKGIFTTGQNFRKAGHQTQNTGRDEESLSTKNKIKIITQERVNGTLRSRLQGVRHFPCQPQMLPAIATDCLKP